MRVLFICNEYPPNLHGGIGSFTRDIAEGLVNAGHSVTIWGIYGKLEKSTCENLNGVTVYRENGLSPKNAFTLLQFILNLNLRLRSFLRKRDFDIIECQEWQGLLPLGLRHKGYVVRLHGAAVFFDKLLNRKGSRLTHLLEALTLKSAKNLIAVSDYCGAETLRLVNLKRRYAVIYNGVDINRLRKFKTPNINPYQIVFANSVLPKKGILELVDAFNHVAEEFPKSTLVVVGKLTYPNIGDLITQRIRPEFRDRIMLTGWLEKAEDVYRYIASAHVCCYPSHMEGFGIAPVEAMALGKAVIFMKNGPGPEVIEDNVSGVLVDTSDPRSIAAGIIKIFKDEDFARRIGENAVVRSSALFDRNTVFINKNVEYYKSIVE